MTTTGTGLRAAEANPPQDACAPRRWVFVTGSRAGVLPAVQRWNRPARIAGATHPARPVPLMRARFRILRRALLAVALSATFAHGGITHAQQLLVVSSSNAPSYQQALTGIRTGADGLALETQLLTAENQETLMRAIRVSGRDTALITLGARASDFALRAAPTMPVVNCMVRSADAARALPNAQVVPMDIPAEAHIEWLRQLLPAARRIGILFDPVINARRVEGLAAALAQAGYAPELVPVPSPNALPQALVRLANAADVVLALPDSTVYTQSTSKPLLLFSFRHSIPLIGPGEAWVKSGALYAVEWDYQELGGYCAALAARMLAGPKAPAPTPVQPQVVVNLRSAEQFRLNWGDDLVSLGHQVRVAK